MFIIFLRFSANRDQAARFMDNHNAWVKRGFDDGVFLVAGSLQPNLGGGILAHNTSLTELQDRAAEDPFVTENVVAAEIIEFTPARTDARLEFLLG